MTTVDDADSGTFEAVILLYLACSKLTDGDLDDAEAGRILELVREHTPKLAASYGESVVADVAARLAELTEPTALLSAIVDAAEQVSDALSPAAKVGIVEDLESITAADGEVSSAERDFVAAVAKTFGVA